MKMISKILVLALVLLLLVSIAPPAQAAILVLEPNETTSFTIEFSNACGLHGTIEFTDPSIFDKIEYDVSDSGLQGLVENGKIFLYSNDSAGVDGRITIRLTMSEDAEEGSSSLVTIRYYVTEAGASLPGAEQVVQTTIMAPQSRPDVQPTPVPETLDFSALVKQLKKAQDLTAHDYTQDSWVAVRNAVDKGLSALNSNSQSEIDKAASKLKSAINSLVPVNYDDLQASLEGLQELSDMEQIAEQWARFSQAVVAANAAKTCGDQITVDAAVAELLASKEALLLALAELGEVVEVEVEVEKIVEKIVTETVYEKVEDGGMPTVFLVVMIICIVICLALGTVVLVYFVKKRRAQQDNTPLVDYDIDSDNI